MNKTHPFHPIETYDLLLLHFVGSHYEELAALDSVGSLVHSARNYWVIREAVNEASFFIQHKHPLAFSSKHHDLALEFYSSELNVLR